MSSNSKNLARRSVLQIMAGAAAFLVKLQASSAAEPSVGVIVDVRGEAFAEAAGKRHTLARNAAVFLGNTLGTGASSRLAALLGRKTNLRLGAQTRIRIDEFVVNTGGELSLHSGAILLDTPADQFDNGLTIKSTFALIAVRGTRFFAGPIGGIFGVFVERGAVEVTASGRTVQLKSGEGTDIAQAGDPPGQPKKWRKPKIAKAMALVR